MSNQEPLLNTVSIVDLRPTQITVGFREVAEKRREWSERPEQDRAAFLGQHMIPVLLGPKKRHYVIDHHHLARALHDEGCETVLVNVVADLSVLEKDGFWVFADNRGWCHPLRCDGPAGRLRPDPEVGRGPRRRPVSQPSRGAAAGGRLRQGNRAVHRIHVGRCPPAPSEAESGRDLLFGGARAGSHLCEESGRSLLAGLVRAERHVLIQALMS